MLLVNFGKFPSSFVFTYDFNNAVQTSPGGKTKNFQHNYLHIYASSFGILSFGSNNSA